MALDRNLLQTTVDELQRGISTLLRIHEGDLEPAGEALPEVLAALQRSLEGLRALVAHSPVDGTATASLLGMPDAIERALSGTETLESADVTILEILCRGAGWDVGEMWSLDGTHRAPRLARLWASRSIDASALQGGPRTSGPSPGACPTASSCAPAWIADIEADESALPEPDGHLTGMHGMFQLPIAVHGEVRVILRFFSREVRPPDAALARLLTAIGHQIGQFLEIRGYEEKIRESEARKRAILEASLDAVITVDDRGKVVEFNAAAEAAFGYPRGEAMGREILDLIVPPRLRQQAQDGLTRYWTTRDSTLLGKRFDTVAMKSDGSEFPVEIAVADTGIETQPLLTIFVCDATARRDAERAIKMYQARMRSLVSDLLLVEERERRRLAVDLHDGLSQTIALTQIKLSALRASVGKRHAEALDAIDELVAQANRAARSISFELSPPVLHDLGLEPAVRWLVENLRARYGIEIVLRDDGLPKPADERVRVILFRSIRELLINAAKHAQARRVHVSLEREGDSLSAAVVDDGVGMELDVAAAGGSGLFSIQERLSRVGGSMRMESAPGEGTKIRLCAPLTSGDPVDERVGA